ncbi:hypothetical protein CcaverHIS002_0501190 [Cutaneotrichosporon cavernicola]|uniref:SH3 domain-containing protein n=1 Tax=Cutaneotrichosporon cavernicola TaxID=279322 RepID=A0AA48QXT0_9TREE|nr:uncharacterized protein CcaverHIS019_0601190 [Cutaneotrichosporon cavernicola]BEI84718.1 hypothetical protein CcaverHIS002_0501190 [Cutaneotrichosporon cavernicola]BEI93660.1 hypothetical protein CcaverHIS019_0601190 [Cutaneotrichosporon cavernicola]BEJ01437.1 hypothetical protein CcaverHIS631_0601190 [Cutaneotrichosporon cavernicola]BEJ09204.1 hypothetical protein CcaverHIS641_0601190 [Cutaneotrichosporon cavernicola]
MFLPALLTFLLGLVSAAPAPKDIIFSHNNAVRCRTSPTHAAPPARLYNAGDYITLECQTLNGYWFTSDGCYVDSMALHPINAAYHPHGPGAGRKRSICPE